MIIDDFESIAEAYLLARASGERGALERLLAAYPQHEDRLLSLALLDEAVPTAGTPDALAAARASVTPALTARALQAASLAAAEAVLVGILARGERLGLSARALAAATDVPRDVLVQLDRRLIAPETVPQRLLGRLAATLQTQVESIAAFLAGGPATRVAAYHFAASPPASTAGQSFAEAVAASALATEEQRAYWAGALREEGLDG